ncbi:unnamed protein product [Phytophthora fragariaefolia]|uniref:Unnamed protein product n=1 Tax=Phytophthora fragariaefolia TaxID=1490495 RepID=A0A9W6WT89_9STRA|nr:unnamed protein product [Phytophthora fragariaefolia]
MALLMPDINLRRAKHHLEVCITTGDPPAKSTAATQNLERLIFGSKSKSPQAVNPVAVGADSAKVAPPTQNLECDPKKEQFAGRDEEVVGETDEKPHAQLDCAPSSVVKSNQETDDEEEELGRDQAAELECSRSWTIERSDGSTQDLKSLAPSSTSTTETSSSVSSVVTTHSSISTTACVGKPPLSRVGPQLSRDNRSSYSSLHSMPQPKYISRVKGPTLGSILQRVHINDGNVSELDFSTLAERNKRLESEGCALVARSLSTNHTVRKLIIRDHSIGDDGAIALSKMLCNNTTIEYLDLFGNEIGDSGAEALAQALYGHDSLTHLSLRDNLITDRGVDALAQAIRCNCTLKSLDLVHNRITQVGAQALLNALNVNFYLETIGLDENSVPEFIESEFAAALARNRAESLILESHAAEKKAVKLVRRASGFDTQDEEEDSSEVDEEEWEGWEDDDGDSVSSGFLTCSNVTDIPLSSSGLWI